MRKIKVKNNTLAGFDGFKSNPAEDYTDADFDYPINSEYLSLVNKFMLVMISNFKKKISKAFLTVSQLNGDYDV